MPPALRAALAVVRVEALAQFLAGLEEGHILVLHEDRIARPRITALPCGTVLDRKGTETAQLDAIAARQGAGNLIEDDIDDALNIAMKKMRIGGGHPLNQLGFDHWHAPKGPRWKNTAFQAPLVGRRVPNGDKTVKFKDRSGLIQQSRELAPREAERGGNRLCCKP